MHEPGWKEEGGCEVVVVVVVVVVLLLLLLLLLKAYALMHVKGCSLTACGQLLTH
jgi:hypothetical protein